LRSFRGCGVSILILGGLAFSLGPQSLLGQSLDELATQCPTASPSQRAWCEWALLGVQAAQGAVGLAISGGTDLPGSASTLGWRTKGSPRFAITLRGLLVSAPMPAPDRTGSLPGQKVSGKLPSVHISGTVGVFDGFFLGPTVGGVGSLDLTVSGQWVGTPRDAGFRKNLWGWGAGGRIGILRESFSLPGVSLSGSYRRVGETELWSVQTGASAESVFDLAVTSLRGVVGKDIGGIGFLAGAGWDRYSGVMDGEVVDPAGVEATHVVQGNMKSDRPLFFLGASMTFLALQLSGEVGWAPGFGSALPVAGSSDFDPSGKTLFGAMALRLTF
jgi:hypothetical protein